MSEEKLTESTEREMEVTIYKTYKYVYFFVSHFYFYSKSTATVWHQDIYALCRSRKLLEFYDMRDIFLASVSSKQDDLTCAGFLSDNLIHRYTSVLQLLIIASHCIR